MTSKATPTARKRRGIGYVRVSRVNGREGDSFISPEVQREQVEALATLNRIDVVDWQTDLDQSGGDYDRDGFQTALAAVERGEADTVLVAKLSRFARSVPDACKAIRRLEAAGGTLIAADLTVDTTTPAGKMMRTVFLAIAEMEREIARDNWRDARSHARARGVYAGKPPVGYARDEAKRLVVDDAVAPFVVALFEGRAAGASWRDLLVDWLDSGGPKITRQGIASIIRKRSYLGEIREGDDVSVDESLAIVTPEVWQAAQGKTPPRPARKGEGSLLTGLLVCGGCGGRMTVGRDGRDRPNYKCQADRSHICKGRMTVGQHIADPEIESAFLAWARFELEGVADEAGSLDEALGAQEDAEAELIAFLAAQSASAVPELFAEGRDERESRVIEARERVADLRTSAGIGDLRMTVAAVWPTLSIAEKRQIIRAGLDRVEIHSSGSRWVAFAERARIVAVDGSVVPFADDVEPPVEAVDGDLSAPLRERLPLAA